MKSFLKISLAICLFSMFSCTPKTTEVVTEVEEKEVIESPKNTEEISECAKFGDNKYSEDAQNAYSLYSRFLSLNKYEEAYEYWRTVYKHTPALDGKEFTVYTDGVIIYDGLLKQTEDSKKQKEYKKKILSLYDEAAVCFPWKKSVLSGRKAFDLYYRFPSFATKTEIYDMFKVTVDSLGMKTPAFVINPMSALLIENYLNGNLPQSEASRDAQELTEIVDHNIKKYPNDESWNIVNDFAPEQLASLEGEKGFYSCDYYKEKYLAIYQRNKTDCDSLQYVYGKLNWGGCDKTSDLLTEINAAIDENCEKIESSDGGSVASQGYQALRDGDYRKAIDFFKMAIQETNDREKMSQYEYIIAQIYYVHLKSYSSSRSHALKAADLRPGWGDPYIMIGKLYASSGPLCGSGRGWNSQVVTWVAIDAWNKAKSVDPAVTSEANKLINQYQKYMPSNGDIHQRSLKVGDTFKVECWIQRSTTIRAAKN